jgi:hypothetical protein
MQPGLEYLALASQAMSDGNFETFMNYTKGIGIGILGLGATILVSWERYKEVNRPRKDSKNRNYF